MKLSTRTSVLKSNVVEISSPRILESPDPACYRKNIHVLEIPAAVAYQSASEEEAAADEDTAQPEYDLAAIAESEQEDPTCQARIDAEEIIAEAERKAAEIVKEARLQGQAEVQQMEEILRNQAFEQAKDEGYAEGLAYAQSEAEALRKQAKDYLESARTVFQDELNKVDKDLAELCIQICSRLLHTTLKQDPEILLNMIRDLTLHPTEKDSIKIHLSSEDWEWYNALSLEDKPAYPVIVDESLNGGETFLECSEGIFDAGIDQQLKNIGQYLQREITHGQMGRTHPEN